MDTSASTAIKRCWTKSVKETRFLGLQKSKGCVFLKPPPRFPYDSRGLSWRTDTGGAFLVRRGVVDEGDAGR